MDYAGNAIEPLLLFVYHKPLFVESDYEWSEKLNILVYSPTP
jgi:hypothetical protein